MSPSDVSRHAVVRLLLLTALACVCSIAVGAARAPVSIVQGIAWNSDNSPLPNARVRLRDTMSGHVVSTSESSTNGQFVFPGIGRGFYIVELLGEGGKVLAVGPNFRVEGGETVTTLVRLPSRRSWYAAMFSNTAAGVIAVASSVGLTALGTQSARPISPQ